MWTVTFILWCGFCWLMRGGKFGAMFRAVFRREPGTTATRITTAFLMAAPLSAIDPLFLWLWPSIYAAMTIGYFDESMGLEQPGRDHIWMAVWGMTVAAVMLLPLTYLVSPWAIAYALGGGFAVLAYAVNKPLGTLWGLDWTERAEIFTGMVFGAALAAASVDFLAKML